VPKIKKNYRFTSLLGASLMLSLGTIEALPATAGAAGQSVNVVGYSVVGPAFKALEAGFQSTPAGQNVTFTNTFGSSDTETNNVANGLPADLVNLSYASNMATLVTDKKVPSSWASQELSVAGVNTSLKGAQQQTVYLTPGILTDSVVVFIVRKGNPLNISNWSDLIKSDAQVVTPNPATSGSAKWNLLAGYAAQLASGDNTEQAYSYLKQLIAHTVAQPSSGSTALAAFLGGTGNVLLDYEDDALAAQSAGDAISIVTPPTTLLIENPVALTTSGLTNPAAKAFYQYAFSTAGQTILANLGYRSVLKSVWSQTSTKFAAFKKASDVYTISQLSASGWSAIDPTFFSPTIAYLPKDRTYPYQGVVTYLERFAGTA
jgi:sulfate/thiosulfate transport system substrate-binding protein